jgi:hypothetical protein
MASSAAASSTLPLQPASKEDAEHVDAQSLQTSDGSAAEAAAASPGMVVKESAKQYRLSFAVGAAALSAQHAVGFVCASHELGLSRQLDQQWVVRLLMQAAAPGKATSQGE